MHLAHNNVVHYFVCFCEVSKVVTNPRLKIEGILLIFVVRTLT